jgi:acyltransferase
LSLGVAGAALVFLLAGQALRHVRTRVKAPIRFGAVCLVAGAAPVLTGTSGPLDMKYNEINTPVLSVVVAVLISSGLPLILKRLFPGLRVHAMFTKLAAGCLMVVLTHTYVLWLLAVADTERSCWVLIAALVLPWSADMILNRTPLYSILLGAPRAT